MVICPGCLAVWKTPFLKCIAPHSINYPGPIFCRSRSLPRILHSLYFPVHSLAETKKNKVGTMNTPGELEAVRERNTRFSMAGKWVNRNERMRYKPVSRSYRAGLQFPVCHREMKSRLHASMRVGTTAAVYMAAVLEYLTAEVMELVGNASKDLNAKRITPRHLQLAVRGDEDLDTLINDTSAGGGVIPYINKTLFQKL